MFANWKAIPTTVSVCLLLCSGSVDGQEPLPAPNTNSAGPGRTDTPLSRPAPSLPAAAECTVPGGGASPVRVIVHAAKPEVVYEDDAGCSTPQNCAPPRKHFLFGNSCRHKCAPPPPPLVGTILTPVPAMVPAVPGQHFTAAPPPCHPQDAMAPGPLPGDSSALAGARAMVSGFAKLQEAELLRESERKAIQAYMSTIAPHLMPRTQDSKEQPPPSNPGTVTPPPQGKEGLTTDWQKDIDEIRQVLAHCQEQLNKLETNHPELFR